MKKKELFYYLIEKKLIIISKYLDKALDSEIISNSEHYSLWSYLTNFVEEVEILKDEVNKNENKNY